MMTHFNYLRESDRISRTIRECARILRKKGTLAIIEFHPNSNRLTDFQHTGAPVMHAEEIITAIAPHGFVWLQTESIGEDIQLCLFRKGNAS